MADKSGTFALFILTSNTEDVGRRNSEGESEAEGVEPGAGVRVWCPARCLVFAFSRADWTRRRPCPASVGPTCWLQPNGSTTYLLWSIQGQPALFLNGGCGHWGRAELGTPVGTGHPYRTDFQRMVLPFSLRIPNWMSHELERRIDRHPSPHPSSQEGKGIFFFTFERHCGSVSKVFTKKKKKIIKKSLVSTGVSP